MLGDSHPPSHVLKLTQTSKLFTMKTVHGGSTSLTIANKRIFS